MKNVLITGVSSGIGESIKNIFIENGYKVYGIDVKNNMDSRFTFFKKDITNKDELESVYKELSNIELDLIINVAGIHKMASLVESNYEILKKVIDVNLLGVMLVNNIFHPLLKKEGRIVIVSSEVAAFSPLPFNGLYSVSKIALDSYAQALRQELNLINQKVITIRPGAIETPLSNNSLTDIENLAASTILYKKQASKFLNISKKFMGTPIKPYKVSKLVFKASTSKKPKITYSIHVNFGMLLLGILPKGLQCFIIKLLLNL